VKLGANEFSESWMWNFLKIAKDFSFQTKKKKNWKKQFVITIEKKNYKKKVPKNILWIYQKKKKKNPQKKIPKNY
jgi:hypothetical protein